MDTFDYVIVGLGIALIVIGLILFIVSKQESKQGNHVEGFGIKLNVSNPSIILIVFGIGLVLFPRLMPPTQVQQPSNVVQPLSQVDAPSPNPQQQVEQVTQPNPINTEPTVTVQQPPAQAVTQPTVFFPQGLWYVTQYEENGIDLSMNIQGTIQFGQQNNNVQDWFANLTVMDIWGNVSNYQYQGLINAIGNNYSIDTQMSNDPSFRRQSPTNLILKMDNPNLLHMEYLFNGSQIILHLSQ